MMMTSAKCRPSVLHLMGLRDPECFSGLAQIGRFDPEHPAVAPGARPVFALDEIPALLSAQLEPCGSCRIREGGAVFRDGVQLGPTRAMRERRDTDQVV